MMCNELEVMEDIENMEDKIDFFFQKLYKYRDDFIKSYFDEKIEISKYDFFKNLLISSVYLGYIILLEDGYEVGSYDDILVEKAQKLLNSYDVYTTVGFKLTRVEEDDEI